MSLVQHNHMIQTLSADRTDQAFRVRILPRRARCGDHFVDVHFPRRLGLRREVFAAKPWFGPDAVG